MIKKKKNYDDGYELQKFIKKNMEIKNKNNFNNIKSVDFIEGEILINPIDYYFTNSIARSSKTMNECRRVKKKLLFTGIEKAS